MFDFLKKKIADFTGKIQQAMAKKPEPEKPNGKEPILSEARPTEQSESRAGLAADLPTVSEEKIAPEKKLHAPEPQMPQESPAPQAGEEEAEEKKERDAEQPEMPKEKIEKHAEGTEKLIEKKTAPAEKAEMQKQGKPQAKKPLQKIERREEKEIFAEKPPEKKPAEEKAPEQVFSEPEFEIAGERKAAIEKVKEIRDEEKRELKAKVGLTQKVFGFLGGKIRIGEKDTQEFFEEFELSLLEADVQQDAAEAIANELKSRIVGREISSREDVTEFLKREVKASLEKVMKTEAIDILGLTAKHKPLKIMFLGPNGAGKTTSIAKIADYFMKAGKRVILAAGDTFRAASIEQLEIHANALGVKVVKHKYGADPAAVAFDAVKAAEAKGIDVVLIDTAGRQETNRNLIEELKKIVRVAKPDLKLYVGEAYTGQALLEQATEFDKAIGIDGFVLTKIDTDTKGGTAISLLYSLKKPIVFVGTGQRYSDLLEFRPEFIIDRII
ncbi:Signal recognition particle receptor FtsY [uncultured archaeon]|nr:Signal recognition particle receptor FtsY [uncultured archaeon]